MNISGILFTIALLIRSFCLLVNELKYITTPSSIVAGTVLEDVTESVTGVPDMKIYSEDDYLNTARRSPDEYMESASDEIKAQVAEFEQLEATEAEKAMQKWDMEIQDSRNVNCQALRGNMAFSEISIDLSLIHISEPTRRS